MITSQGLPLRGCSYKHHLKASDIRYELSSPNVSDKPFIVGVAGGTSSGKTTIAERLADSMGAHELALVKLDSYYISRTEQPMEERAAANYDHPSAFDWDLLNQHLNELLNWRPAPVPTYDYTIHDRTDIVDVVQPARIVVVEGILVLWNTELRNQFDLKVFVDTPRPQVHPTSRTRCCRAWKNSREHHFSVSRDRSAKPRRLHRTKSFPCRCHHSRGRAQSTALDVLLARGARNRDLSGALRGAGGDARQQLICKVVAEGNDHTSVTELCQTHRRHGWHLDELNYSPKYPNEGLCDPQGCFFIDVINLDAPSAPSVEFVGVPISKPSAARSSDIRPADPLMLLRLPR